jgi:hypothetical protein
MTVVRRRQKPKPPAARFPFVNSAWDVSREDIEKHWTYNVLAAAEYVNKIDSSNLTIHPDTQRFTFKSLTHPNLSIVLSMALKFDGSLQTFNDTVEALDHVSAVIREAEEAKVRREKRLAALKRLDDIDPTLRTDLGL